MTLASSFIANKISNWHVSNETSCSDHRQIRFDLEARQSKNEVTRVPKLTNWTLYEELIKQDADDLNQRIHTTDEVDRVANTLQSLIIKSYEQSCPPKQRKVNRNVPWWNNSFEELRRTTRRLFNTAKRTGNWGEYQRSLADYNKELRSSKQRSWRSLCESIDDVPAAARLHKILSKESSNGIGFLLKKYGSYTRSAEETSKLLLETHFPGSRLNEYVDDELPLPKVGYRPSGEVRSLSNKIFTPEKVRCAINGFKPYTSPGGDGIFRAMLQHGMDVIQNPLREIVKASYALSYVPQAWRKGNVVFIPKAGGRCETQPRSYRPISLSSFLLKTMERILDLHIRSETLMLSPLHFQQHAYQKGKSTETALSCILNTVEKAISNKGIALCAF